MTTSLSASLTPLGQMVGNFCRTRKKRALKPGPVNIPSPDLALLPDTDLLHLVSDGNSLALQTLMARYGRMILSLAQRITGNPTDADDIAQETFLKCWIMAPNWSAGGKAQLSTWLYRVALNAALDRQRRIPFSPLEDAPDLPCPAPNPFDQTRTSKTQLVIRAALLDLSKKQRAALSLYYFSDLSAPDAAAIMGLSTQALEALLVRGKKALRKILEQRGILRMDDLHG
jgi:RNA polymerase sigma-70 factor, ECF subfamily